MAKKIITKGGMCAVKRKPMGFQFISEDGKCTLGGSFGGADIVVAPDALPSEIDISDAYLGKGCKYCGNTHAYVCPACGAVVCDDGKAKGNHACPSCGSVLSVAAASGKRVQRVTLVRKASFTSVKGDASENGPYTKWAGVSKIDGAATDKFGNAAGSQYDLARDGGFRGQKVVIASSLGYAQTHMRLVTSALQTKGFTVQNLSPRVPSPTELETILRDANQFWLISQANVSFTPAHAKVIREFFERGHGVYLWGDNDPLNGDVNAVASAIFPGVRIFGNYLGEKVLSIQSRAGEPGIVANHLISTGITAFYEGTSIANLTLPDTLTPLVYSSDRKIVTAYFDRDGRRALIDGGFTRLWDDYGGKTAGTSRYIVNAAAWLANVERFGF